MPAQRVSSLTYTNGTAPNPQEDAARTDAFFDKLLQLHKDASNDKNHRLKLSAPVGDTFSQARDTNASSIVPPVVAHTQIDMSMQLPGINNQQAPTTAPQRQSFTAPIPSGSSGTPAQKQFNPVLLEKSNDLLDAETRIRVKKQRERLEKAVLDQAKGEELARRGEIEVPLNLLALAQASVPPSFGYKEDTPDDSFDADSYYSSKANSWSTEHTEPITQLDTAIVISDGDDDELYEPPSQMDVPISKSAHGKIPGIQEPEGHLSDGQWEPEWDEDEDYEPPASTAFDGPERAPVPQVSGFRQGQGRHVAEQERSHNIPQPTMNPGYGAQQRRAGGAHAYGNSISAPMNVAVNHIAAPAAPQPSRISPLTTGNLTHTMQSQISHVQQNHQGGVTPQQSKPRKADRYPLRSADPKKERKAKRLERAAAKQEKKNKRKRVGTPETQNKRGKRLAGDHQASSPEPYIKPEPASPPSGLAAIPTRRPSIVQHGPPEPPALSSPYNASPHSAYVSDQDTSPRGYRYANADSMAMPPPAPLRRVERDTHDLRRVASLQYARRPLSPTRDQMTYADPRASAPRYDYAERPTSRGPAYREPSMRPPVARAPRSPSPPRAASSYGRAPTPSRAAAPPAPGQIIEDAYGNRWVAELVPDDYPSPSRRAQDEYYAQHPPARHAEPYEENPFRMQPPASRARAYSHVPEPAPIDNRARAYSRMPEPAPVDNRTRAYSRMPEPAPVDHRARAYSRMPEPATDPQVPQRAYSVVPQDIPRASVPQRQYGGEEVVYERHPASTRYEAEVVPRAAYAPEYLPRPYSVRPEATRRAPVPDYSARAGSVAPGYVGREMAPPSGPVFRSREQVPAEDAYRYAPAQYEAAPEARPQYDERRVASYRY